MKIIIRKKERVLEIVDGSGTVRSYKISLGSSPDGEKELEGDKRTPEGEFYIFTKNPESKYFLSLGISYPSIEAAERGLEKQQITREEYQSICDAIAQRQKPPQYTALGGEIYIHGGGCEKDWTQGCIALSDIDIREIFDAVPVGTKVTIVP